MTVESGQICAKFAEKERGWKAGFTNLIVVAVIVYAWNQSLKELDQLQALSHNNTGYILWWGWEKTVLTHC